MLKHRLWTASVLIALVFFILFFLPPAALAYVTGLIGLGAAWEWSRLAGITNTQMRGWYLLLLAVSSIFIWLLYLSDLLSGTFLLSLVLLWWITALFWVIRYPHHQLVWANNNYRLGLIGGLVLVPFWLGLLLIRHHPQGQGLLLFLLILVWVSDSGAYFVGRRWGKTALAVNVSPNKTREGLYGALGVGLITSIIGAFCFGLTWQKWLLFILLSLVVVLFSVLGDLLESMIKRARGVKDSGRLLPGHGGLLDRIDSLTAAAPIFALGVILFGI